jgi:hypothetical protein
MQILLRDHMVTKPGLNIPSDKSMFMMMSKASGFYVVHKFLNDAKINNDYFGTNILILFKQRIFPGGSTPHQKWLVIDLDNGSVYIRRASTDWLDECGMRRMLYPLPLFTWFDSQSFLFVSYSERKVRMNSGGQWWPVFESLPEILRGIDQAQLNGVFQAWMLRVQEISQGNGDYVVW